jgi:hypothetical protein
LRLNGRAFAARENVPSRAAGLAWNAQARLMASPGDAMLLRWIWLSTRGRSVTCRSVTCRSVTCRNMTCRNMTCSARDCAAARRRGRSFSRLTAVVANSPAASSLELGSQKPSSHELPPNRRRRYPRGTRRKRHQSCSTRTSALIARRRHAECGTHGLLSLPKCPPDGRRERTLSRCRMPKRGTTGTFNHQQALLTAASAHWQAA